MKALDYFTILSSSVLIRITIFYYLIFQYQMKALDYSRFLFFTIFIYLTFTHPETKGWQHFVCPL